MRIMQQGFTLVELMITIAIIGIIVSVAYPNYQSYIVKTSRGVAQADLMSLAAAMERHKAASFSYEAAAAGSSNSGAPAFFYQHSPSAEHYNDRKYNLSIKESSVSAYVLEAVPRSGTTQDGNGRLALFSDGRRAWQKIPGTYDGQFCWNC